MEFCGGGGCVRLGIRYGENKKNNQKRPRFRFSLNEVVFPGKLIKMLNLKAVT